MRLSGIFARIVALIGAAALLWRRLQGAAPEPAWGSAPVVPAAKPQGSIPTLKMPTAQGWTDGHTPVAAPGLKVNAFATGLKHPRWIEVLPNGDVLIAESNQVAGPIRSVFSYAMQATMRRARALGVSANRITLLRDTDGDGAAEKREIFIEGLNQPFGMALLGDTFYVGNTDGVVAFPYVAGADRITGPGRKLVTFKPDGHWTRSPLPSPDGRNASGLSRRCGHRAARLLEPQHAEWLQGRLRAVRERAPGRAAAGYSDRIPRTGRAGVLWTTGRSNTRSGRLRSSGGRCWRCDLARNERAAWLTDRDSLCRRSKCPLAEPISAKASGTYRPCPFGAKGRRALFPKLRYGHHLRRNRTGPLLMLREIRTAQVWIQPMVGIRLRYLQK